jgi:hypothetical protein
MAVSCCAFSRPSVTSFSASRCLSRKGPELRSSRAKSTSAGLVEEEDAAEEELEAAAVAAEEVTAPLAFRIVEVAVDEEEPEEEEAFSFARAAAAAASVAALLLCVEEVGATIWMPLRVVRSKRAAEIK